jgi:N-acetylglucosaminyldiphosphoundecaprenol N-acetyl-beta-D-mannosaminyltransferase
MYGEVDRHANGGAARTAWDLGANGIKNREQTIKEEKFSKPIRNPQTGQGESMSSGVVIAESGEVTIPSFRVLGARIHAVQIPDVLRIVDHWINERKGVHIVCQTGMHGASEAVSHPKLREMINDADLNNPDGAPMTWLARLHGFKHVKRRAYGPEVMGTLLRETGPKYKHFFYGNRVSEELGRMLTRKYGTRVVGTYPLPIWPLPEAEKVKIAEVIEAAAPDIVWVGLGAPRQEGFMFDFRSRLTVPVLIGVGAAFDFHAGKLKQAPSWMQENGLEWFYRFAHEPKRLWRRYLVNGPIFVWNVGLELAGLKKFS